MSVRIVGAVRTLLRYPVKSMAGERLEEARVLADHGVQGDRAFAVQDVATGRIASAKHPRQWGPLLAYRPRFLAALTGEARRGPVAIELPDGTVAEGEAIDRRLSRALGREVRLVDTPPPQALYERSEPGSEVVRGDPLAIGAGVGTFFDFAPVHVIASASLEHLKNVRPGSDFAVARFRPNVVIDTPGAPGFVENEWVGQLLTIGDEVQLCVTFPCPRCVMTTLAQGPLPADAEVLRTIAGHNAPLFALLARKLPSLGAYATVVRGGVVRPGDAVRLAGRAPLRQLAAVVRAVKRALHRR